MSNRIPVDRILAECIIQYNCYWRMVKSIYIFIHLKSKIINEICKNKIQKFLPQEIKNKEK